MAGDQEQNNGKREGIKTYYKARIEQLEIVKNEKIMNLRRLEAQRNELNTKGFIFF